MRGLILHSTLLSLVPLKTESRGFMRVFFFSMGAAAAVAVAAAAAGVVVGGGVE